MEYLTLHVIPRPDGSWRCTVNRLSTRAVMGHPKRIGVLAETALNVPDGADIDQVAGWLLAHLVDRPKREGQSWTDTPLPGL